MTVKCLFIGLDGATFDVLDPLMARGAMPFLASVVERGGRAPLRSTIPALTPPAWTTLMTGRAPAAHGIFDFFRRESKESLQFSFLTSRDIGVETIWQRANRAGQRVTVLNFPLTFPAPPVDGYVVAGGWMPWRQLRSGCHPKTLYDELKRLPDFNPRTLAMDMSHEEKALEGCEQEDYEPWVALHIERERQWHGVARHLMTTDPTEMFALLMDGVDKLQHLCWRFIDPAMADQLTEPWEARVRDRCLDYFRTVDEIIADLAGLAGEEAMIVIASDHGFGPQVRTFFVNQWLAEAGYLAWTDKRQSATEATTLGIASLAKHTFQMDWTRTVAYAPMPSGNGIHLVRQDEAHPHGIPAEALAAVRQRIIEGLLAVRDPHTGEAVVDRVWTRAQLFAGPWEQIAPDLTLELSDGGLISIVAADAVVMPRPQPTGTHAPLGVLIAAGAGVQEGVTLPEKQIVDSASLLLYAVDAPIPADLEGELPTHLFSAAWLERNPPQQSDEVGVQPVATVEKEALFTEEEQSEMLRHLQALGYVE
ncbi:MAG: alkaline phosphatase family protein [Anaerolineales bacterium]|nr:alkaline phosphatase family protein [Anaerolineales bacterium]MCB9129177.1 alkaline phosphatase family protein [Ardenticatenales bacterium]